jgi:ADP-dependent NAD(P)H-hydrate dehydratase / NAD(P)H-hydrate epimerase
MRDIDRLTTERYGIPSLTLMENAANATARCVTRLLDGDVSRKSILVFCGKGNNGGDGAAVARLLAIAGGRVEVVLIGRTEETKGDARENFDRLRSWNDVRVAQESKDAQSLEVGAINLFECESEKGWQQLLTSVLAAPHHAIVDALFGTGLTRPVEGIHREAIRYMNGLRKDRDQRPGLNCPIISVDIPSGLNADSEQPIGESVNADATVTMTAPKRANVLPPASDYNSTLVIADIGSPAELINEQPTQLLLSDADDARRWLFRTRYAAGSYKNMHGHALIIAGSRGFTGAAALCGNAAMRAGAGLVTVATPVSAQPIVATQVMSEVMTTSLPETDRGAVSADGLDFLAKLAPKMDVIAVGPGLSSEDDRTRTFVRQLVERRVTPVVIDADGLNCLAPWPNELRGSPENPIVLTPHAGEMLRLLGTTDKSALSDRVNAAREFAARHEVLLVLKGSRTIIATPDGRVTINPTGNAGLGTAGSGDTLTGVITSFIAQARGILRDQMDAFETVSAAVYVSGLAGDLAARKLGMRAMVASDIREHLSEAFRYLDPTGESPNMWADEV